MAGIKIKPDHAGMGAILAGGQVTAMTTGAARQVAGRTNATAGGEVIPVDAVATRVRLRRDTQARAAAVVAMKHPAAVRVEAKRGPLAKAAASMGLKVAKW